MKKMLSMALATVLALSLSVPAFAAGVKSFSDVPSNYWAYSYIMEMVDEGLFNGTTTPDKNGVGTFNPEGTMTRGAFITVISRYFWPEEVNNMPTQSGAKWWQNYYTVAVNHGILNKSELNNGNMDAAMTREEMAMVIARAVNYLGRTPSTLVDSSKIADWNSINSYYREGVRTAYTLGILSGVDSKGTFNPKGVLTRAQAATVVYRLIDFVDASSSESKYTPWEGKGVNYNIEIPLDNPIVNMPNTAAIARKYGYTPKTTTGAFVHVGFSNMWTMSNGCMITGFAWESNAADVWEIQTAMIKDMLDAESANAFLSWLNHANELQKAYFDAEVGSQEEANALAQLEKEIAPIIDSDSTRFGNVDVTFECSENGFPQSIVFENVN